MKKEIGQSTTPHEEVFHGVPVCRLSDGTSRSWAENKSPKRNQERLGKLLWGGERAICLTKCLCVNIVVFFHKGVSRSHTIFYADFSRSRFGFAFGNYGLRVMNH